ncbi:MAG: ATP-binding cassette domain-containing protein [Candidatus Aminicenantes bacterium]|nr:ATP-binding cassette domain-containing protein [Candidatus Aminicenantes bacterium]NIM84870.1 ATP-binding cassette domain-containing protein [Candidatus Aminicenantes bacterium]NIN24378.1 ATP-binding cassette domain-containing protein [Candidatus Aminicenantes bacterium]NIN48142.1 ATP-binding cassette domain-containing protein [Candidatus Aminicenantes bacterium]NIN91045.1 ATP-binding cassette domain-containing protein [Candidatus Aminicenantes bacterium]
MLLELKHIEKKFKTPSGKGEITVLNDISLNVARGEAIAVVGPSGSGKTTLLNIIGSLDKPSSGQVNFAGKNLADLDDAELSKTRNLDIGFVFQLHHLLPQCTVLENVLIPTIPFGSRKDSSDAESMAKKLLERVGLEKHLDYFPAQLSGGELQRAAVVRALINKPKLVLADEPTGSLDRESAENLGHLLVKLNKEEGTTLIVVTHSLELARLMDNVYNLKNGTLEELTMT